MPRAARKVSSSGIYHIMIRGINRSVIFNDENDKNKFIEIMEKTKEETKYELYAYCLMDKHAHFLMKENEVSISLIMKKICGIYGAWYNYTHHRVGHLFQDRFKSECVDKESYFYVVLKYILNNPVKSHMVEELADYKWSSYHEYIKTNKLTDTKFFMEMLDPNKKKAKNLFIDEFKKEDQEIVNLTIENVRRTDKEAEEIITIEMKLLKVEVMGQMSVESRISFIKSLKAKGITNRQIMGITV